MGTVVVNGKTYEVSSNCNIQVVNDGVFVNGKLVTEGIVDFNGKEVGSLVIVIQSDSQTQLNVDGRVARIDVSGNLNALNGENATLGTLNVGNNLSSTAEINANTVSAGNNITANNLNANNVNAGNNVKCINGNNFLFT